MIAKLAGDKRDGRGRSFKALVAYILHDKDRAATSTRVAWAEPVNCGLSGNLRNAWHEMVLTWENRAALKRAAGLAATGRDNTRPVLHLALSWHPDETPDRREMMEAALGALDWLELGEHQAIVAAHNDEPHPHVHIAINTVHPFTGRTASLYQCKKALSAWALHWEETHGGILVPARILNRLHPAPASAAPPEEPIITADISPVPAGAPANDNDAPGRPDIVDSADLRPGLAARFRRAVAGFMIRWGVRSLFARTTATARLPALSQGAESAVSAAASRRRHGALSP